MNKNVRRTPVEDDSRKGFRRFLFPKYDELRTFFMALSFILLVFFSPDLQDGIKAVVNKVFKFGVKESAWVTIAAVLFTTGLILSVYHAFSKRKKSALEKMLMLIFGLSVSGIAGVNAGLYILAKCNEVLILFPLLNILTTVSHLYVIGFGDETMMDDTDAPPLKLALGSAIMVAVFYICQFQLKLYWSVTFSICVAYAMHINDVVTTLFLKKSGYNKRVQRIAEKARSR